MDNANFMIEHAIDASKNSYSPYSNFRVGAAILLADNKVILGCNIENVSYPVSICAERAALSACYSKGYTKKDIISFAIVGETENFITPCGACRQVMSELISDSCEVILSNLDKSKVHKCTINDLLPLTFNM